MHRVYFSRYTIWLIIIVGAVWSEIALTFDLLCSPMCGPSSNSSNSSISRDTVFIRQFHGLFYSGLHIRLNALVKPASPTNCTSFAFPGASAFKTHTQFHVPYDILTRNSHRACAHYTRTPSVIKVNLPRLNGVLIYVPPVLTLVVLCAFTYLHFYVDNAFWKTVIVAEALPRVWRVKKWPMSLFLQSFSQRRNAIVRDDCR